ncbi:MULTISPECIES: alanine/glycine:cation symporter family protein [Aliiglaciecola]|uniref:alanine/glycine:cation symporter family protein n=1 Tax=Aliiglaciecola TaxID=1406885 RepID=UPI001C08F0F6|nr:MULTISPECIES: alanine/glycine:cation symporter family protein [unclassified Aliiglaciecola]MBU2878207.1 alanine:cation symporter family protein [Aliiglaciecola lipolytica]MDO6711668.1 alanine/glycine:cation symporter family protein [Aliiglaciecola sp. 2_MG-2023]MDO6752739.1 alanine/glycine:cation symporter family protein [Aliiglaciecola sp. 1_MG-2023]
MINDIVSFINDLLWNRGLSVLWETEGEQSNFYFPILAVMLVCAGVWFTVRLGFLQFRHFGHMFSIMKNSTQSDASGISSFQALCTSLSARVGTGNLAGVAVAISLGGSGSIFWMWMIALLGMATGFAESVLGQLYKVRDINGEFRGGPAYYIQQGLNKRWLAVLFSLFLFLGYGFIFSAVQANTITDALNHAYEIPTHYSGLVIILMAGMIVVGGLRAIARFAEWIVPFMAITYVLVTLGIAIANYELVPAMLSDIISSAFGLHEAAAGALGAAIKNGIQRGLYSNEAGSGSVPHAAAGASPNPNHPVSQGYVQMLGVFIDTMILCTCTAIVILLAGGSSSEQMEGIRLTQDAMGSHLGEFGGDFVAAAISLFAFTSVVANYAYGESNLHMFKLDNKVGRWVYTGGYLLMIFWGSMASLPKVWAMADMALGLMTFINIIAIVLMTPTIVSISQDYFEKRKKGQKPEYLNGDCEIQGETEKGIWGK